MVVFKVRISLLSHTIIYVTFTLRFITILAFYVNIIDVILVETEKPPPKLETLPPKLQK